MAQSHPPSLSGELRAVGSLASVLDVLTTRFMRSRAAEVTQYLSSLLDFGVKAGSSLLNLPLDILLDEIFLYLFVEDILSLRRVSGQRSCIVNRL